MKRRAGGFPVSSAQGMGNRGTASEALISKSLSPPKARFPKSTPGEPKSSASLGCPLLGVQRHFRPHDAAYDELVDVLYSLFLEPPITNPAPRSESPELTCFSGASE